MVGLGGSKKENPNSAIFQDQEGSFNYIVVALQFVTCDKNKRENERQKKERKNTRMKSKVQLVEPILSLF